jgi:hypothetical protein
MARRLLVLFVLFAAASACSNEKSPTVPAPKTSTTTAPSTSTSTTVGGGSTSSSLGATTTTTPSGAGLPLKGTTGSGTFTWSVDASKAQFCYRITISGVGSAKSARLLNGSDAVLTLVAPGVNGTVNTCSPTDSITVQQLQQNPAAFSIEVVADKGTLKGALK